MSDRSVTLTSHTQGRLYWPSVSSSCTNWQQPSTPTIVFFVGGGWEMRNVNHTSYQRLARVMADRGWVILIPEFRCAGWGVSYFYTLLPLHFMLVWTSYVCLAKPSRHRMFIATVVALAVSVLLCLFFFMGAEWFPVSFDDQIDDCVQSVKWTQTSDFQRLLGFKPSNVFVMGYSSGANLAAIVNTKGIECIKGCISVNGIMDGQVADNWSWMIWFWVSVFGAEYKNHLPLETYIQTIKYCHEKEKQPVKVSPILVVTGSHESPALQQSCFRFAYGLSRLGIPIQFLHMPYKDHWSALDDLLYNYTDGHFHLSLSKPLLYHLQNFIYSHMNIRNT